MTTTQKLMTEDDLLHMPGDGYRYELIEGELRQMPLAGYEHGRCTSHLSHILATHVHANNLGDVLAAETGFIIARTADGRVPAHADRRKYLELAPDLVAETLSPSDTAVEVEEKIAAWLKAGVRVALIVNPASRSVTVYRSLSDITILTDKDELDLDDVVSGFRCRVSEIFD